MRALAVLALACASGACAKTTTEWIAELDDADPFARRLSAIALSTSGAQDAERVVRVLARHLVDDDADVFRALLAALDRTADRAVPALVDEIEPEHILYSARKQAVLALLAQKRALVLPELVARLRLPQHNDPRRIASLMHELAPHEVPLLCAVLDDERPHVRWIATRVLGVVVTDQGALVRALTPVLLDRDAKVRQAAAEILSAKVGNEHAGRQALRQVLRDPEPAVRAAALAPIVQAQITHLADPDPHAVRNARALLSMLEPADIDALIGALENQNPTCARGALRALLSLVQLEQPLCSLLDRGRRTEADQHADAHDAAARPSLPTLVDELERALPIERARAALLLGCTALDDPLAQPALIRALHAPQACVRLCAGFSLWRSKSWLPAATPALIELRSDDEPLVRELSNSLLDHARQR